jgi:hypothetical protein
VGVSPTGVRARSPVAWMAGRRETECPEAHRRSHPWGGKRATGPKRAVNVDAASKSARSGGRAFSGVAKAAWPAENWLKRLVTPAGWQTSARWHGCVERLVKPSSPRRESVGSKVGRITAETPREVGRR